MKRDKKIDLIKGLGIICMVAGHCGVPFKSFIYLFHMAIFFLASGYCYKKYNAENIQAVVKYIINKFKTLWFPYVLWTVIFSLCHNIFIKLNIYTNDSTIFQYLSEDKVSLKEFVSITDMVKSVVNAFVLRGRTEMGGAFWFLITLFEISIIYCVIEYFIKQIGMQKISKLLQTVVAIAFLGMGFLCSIRGITTFGVNRIFTCYSLFHMGFLIKEIGIMAKIEKTIVHIVVGITSLSMLLMMDRLGAISLGDNSYVNPIFLLAATVAGWCLLYELAWLIEKIKMLDKIVICLGQNTLAIVIFHFLSFKLVSLVGVLVETKPVFLIAAFPYLYDGPIWCMAYLVVGLGGPLCLSLVWKKVKMNFFKSACNISHSLP